MAVAIKKDDSDSVLVRDEELNFEAWVDVWEQEGELTADWNQYIFFTDDKHDMKQKRFQDDCEIAGDFFNVALNFFENTIKK